MKKNLHVQLLLGLLLGAMAFSTLNAQKTLTANVPADAATVGDAMKAVRDDLVPGDSLVITVDPGTYILGETWGLGWVTLHTNVLIKGAGADQTIFKYDLTGRPGPDEPGQDIIHNIWSEDNDSSTIKIEGIKYMYGGNYTDKGSGLGAVLRLFKPNSLEITFENCIFDNNTGITLFTGWKPDISYFFNNCQFTNNLTLGLGNAARSGLMGLDNLKVLSVTNCTFMSNETIDADEPDYRNNTAGAAINFSGAGGQISELILENNAFIDSRVNIAEFDTILPVVKVTAGDTILNVTMRNNIFMGNYPDAAEYADLLLINPENMVFTSEGNIMNKVVRLGTGADSVNYLDYSLDGALIDETYSYTDPRIDFTMSFDLPELILDEHGIGHVEYAGSGIGVGVNPNQYNELNAYVYNNILKVKSLKPGDRVDVYNILGAMVKSKHATSDVLEMSLPKGIFIIRSGQYTKKVYSH